MQHSVPFPESEMDSETRLLCKIIDQEHTLTDHDCNGIDWDHFLTVLETHRIANTVYTDGRILPYLPTKLKVQLQTKYKASQFRMLSYIAELHRIISLFEKNFISSITLKGPTLGQAYYRTPTQRESKDLDILVKPCDFQKAFDILTEEGYLVSGTSWGSPKQQEVYMANFHHYSFYHPVRFTQVELHWKLYSSQSINSSQMENIWRNLTFQKVGSLEITVLSQIDNFIFLCVHGGAYAHQWKRLFWIQDIANIMKTEGEQFIEKCYHSSSHYGAGRYVLEACFLAGFFFKVKVPGLVLLAIKNDARIATLIRSSFYALSNVTSSDQSHTPNWVSLKSGFLTLQRIYSVGGVKLLLTVVKRLLFIYPEGWKRYSFSDRFFALNYFIAPFQRLYSFMTSHEIR
jgi:hypothetical protein